MSWLRREARFVVLFLLSIATLLNFSASRPLINSNLGREITSTSASGTMLDKSLANNNEAKVTMKNLPHGKNGGKELVMIAGSALPDCSHACGPCSPCQRITVSLMCVESRNSEACPSTYRCMCNGKSFPVP